MMRMGFSAIHPIPKSQRNKPNAFMKARRILINPRTRVGSILLLSCVWLLIIWPEDERSIANRLANEEKKEKKDEESTSNRKTKTEEQKIGEDDPTAPAKLHGNEPSKGAKIDKELQDEEAALIAKKDAKKSNR